MFSLSPTSSVHVPSSLPPIPHPYVIIMELKSSVPGEIRGELEKRGGH